MRNLSRKQCLIGGATAVLVMGVVGLVYAAWTTTGTGSGYAKAKSAQTLTTVDVSASTSATLYPGADGDVLIKVSNPNPYPVQVTDVKGSGTITADSGHSTCGSDGSHPAGVTFTDQAGLKINVAANSSTQTTLTSAAHMTNASDDSCQGATFTVPVSLSGQSNAP
jgi:cytoskeletal protein RodZ